ncbi:MAG: FtsX-like permease family protein [Bacteroidota bacterium]
MRRRLVLYIGAMAMGVAALVAIRSFGDNLSTAVEEQTIEVFGGDLQARRGVPFQERDDIVLDSIATATGATLVREVSFPSMALFPASEVTRFVQVRALDGPYPLYGQVEAFPETAVKAFRDTGGAMAEAALLLQMNAEVGDSVRVGNRTYPIVGRVDRVPGQSDVGSLVGPQLYLPRGQIDSTLTGFGSRTRSTAFFRIASADEQEKAALALEEAGFRVERAVEEQAEWTEATGDLARFLSLVGVVALLLGGLGVASAMGVYAREKAETVATLRCLGLSSWRVLAIYALQALALGTVGAGIGVILGVGVQRLLPAVLAPFLPVTVANDLVPSALLEGLGVGVVAAVLFALLPLAAVRRVPPLRALRADATARGLDPLRLVLGLALLGAAYGFVFLQTQDWRIALGFLGGLAVSFGGLAVLAAVVRRLARGVARPSWPFAWRQGIANLHAPGNQTLVLLLALGLGVFLVLTLGLTQRAILDGLTLPRDDEQRPDVVLFDVQPDQADSVRTIVAEQGLSIVGEVPLVQMRIAAIDGIAADSLLADTSEAGPERWAIAREYRSTYRGGLTDTEVLTEGTFVGTASTDDAVIPVSMDQDMAADLGVKLGGRITWNVSGVDIESEVTSLREIDWARPQPNFFAVFPEGPLDAAPQTVVMLTRAQSAEASASLQTRVVDAFPNVSAVDVRQVLALVERVLGQVAFALRFLAFFAVATGLAVLGAAVRVALARRTREAVLLRTIGASREQVRRIVVAEYAGLGLLAALMGGALAVAAAWALAQFAFQIPFRPDPWWLVATALLVPALVAVVGVLGSRSALARPPLDVLRAEE